MFGIRVTPTGPVGPRGRAPVHGPAIRCRTTPAALKLPFFSRPSLPGDTAIDAAGNDTVGAAGTQLGRRPIAHESRRGAARRTHAHARDARGIHGFSRGQHGIWPGSIDDDPSRRCCRTAGARSAPSEAGGREISGEYHAPLSNTRFCLRRGKGREGKGGALQNRNHAARLLPPVDRTSDQIHLTPPRPPGGRRDGFGGAPRDGREHGGPHQPHRAEVPQDRDPPQAVEAGGGPEDGARGVAPQDPRRAMQVGELDLGAPRHDGDQGHRRHVQLTGYRVLRHPHEVPVPRFVHR